MKPDTNAALHTLLADWRRREIESHALAQNAAAMHFSSYGTHAANERTFKTCADELQATLSAHE